MKKYKDIETLTRFKEIESMLKNKSITDEERECLKEERSWLITMNPWLGYV